MLTGLWPHPGGIYSPERGVTVQHDSLETHKQADVMKESLMVNQDLEFGVKCEKVGVCYLLNSVFASECKFHL